jgi:hypothetical protein
VAWGEIQDRRDLLRLTALTARASADKDIDQLKDYIPPSEALSDWLWADGEEEKPEETQREATILQFVRDVGGEVG